MKVAVLTMTRDRLEYTNHCFASLEKNAGCDYDHFVWDNGSTDGSLEWLRSWIHGGKPGRHRTLATEDTNIGITKAANRLLRYPDLDEVDVVVRFDNDCEVTMPGTLKACAEASMNYGVICAPRVLGLINPPRTLRRLRAGDELMQETEILGGIFMSIPAFLFSEEGFRWDETNPLGSGDEAIVPWYRARGGICGYLQDWSVNHYETTRGQHERYPEYFARTKEEAMA